jgi:uncharacterized protein YndB with AHSA1/START domain
MPITSVQSDPAALTLTASGEYEVPVERLWEAFADPRQLERFWGPPQWPATFTRHDMTEGGRSEYFMSGPNGEISRGYWQIERVVPYREFAVRDGFCTPDGSANAAMPECRMHVRFEATARGSRFIAVSTFSDVESMERLLAMGMQEGLTAALGQLDGVLADPTDAARIGDARLQLLDDTHVVVTRVVRGSIEEVWRAHDEEALLRRWMLGPDGWRMGACEVAKSVGDAYRYEWEREDGTGGFGFTGELLESEAPRRAVTTERMIGMDGPGTTNELTLTPQPGSRTLIAVRITYPSKDLRDMVIGTGMVGGMEASYARLERVLEGD